MDLPQKEEEAIQVKWPEVRQAFPNKWLIIDVLEAHTAEDSERILESIVPAGNEDRKPFVRL